MGQELLVTAVQMFGAATAISNGGVLLKPLLVRRVLDAEGATVSENAPAATKRVISAQTAKAILDAMEKVSSAGGTGWRAKVKDIRMAVKTGTAQMIDRDTKRYSDTDYIASTLAIFPADDPKVIVYLAIVKPTGESYYGGRIAAPVVRDAVDAILSVTDLPRADSPSVEHSDRVVLPHLEPAAIGDSMRVRNRAGEKCSRCGATIRKAGVLGYDAFFCPVCQPDLAGKGLDWKKLEG